MYTIICTTYNELKDGSLQLRNNWTNNIFSIEDLENFLSDYHIEFMSPLCVPIHEVSNIHEGRTSINHPIHIRIVRLS